MTAKTAKKKTIPATPAARPPRPVGDQILIRRDTAADQTPGGIVLPTGAQQKQARGVVLAVGIGQLTKDGTRAPIEVQPGDEVVFGTFGGTEVSLDGNIYVVLRESDVLLVL